MSTDKQDWRTCSRCKGNALCGAKRSPGGDRQSQQSPKWQNWIRSICKRHLTRLAWKLLPWGNQGGRQVGGVTRFADEARPYCKSYAPVRSRALVVWKPLSLSQMAWVQVELQKSRLATYHSSCLSASASFKGKEVQTVYLSHPLRAMLQSTSNMENGNTASFEIGNIKLPRKKTNVSRVKI